MVNNIIAILIGLVAAIVVIYLVESLSNALYPLPEGLDPRDMEAMKNYMGQAPAGAMVLVLLAYAFGAFAGGLATTLYAKKNQRVLAIILGAILEILVVLNVVMLPHPVWFIVVALALVLPLTLAGYWAAMKYRPVKAA